MSLSTDDPHEEGTSSGVLASGTRQILFLPRLTIRKLAAALEQAEKDGSYAHALACVDLLDYDSVCALADPGDPDNDPNLMPSRFMVLRGATDAGLKDKGNLDDYPYPLGEGMPREAGCQALADFLVLSGSLDGGVPAWWKSNSDGAPPREFPGCDQELTDAFDDFADGCDACYPLYEMPEEHAVVDGETLGSIAESYGIRSWTLLWEMNKDTVSSPSDALQAGSTLKLPADKTLDTSKFEDWIEGYSGVEPASAWGYFDPRTVLLDESGRFVYRFAEIADCHFLPNGFVPFLSTGADFPQVLATVVGYAEAQGDPGCLVLGHCDPADATDDAAGVSLRRAQAVQAVLGRDADAWAGLVQDATSDEVEATLSGFASVLGWDCDPGPGGDTAIQSFRATCGEIYGFDLPTAGDWTTMHWKAVHRVLCGQVALRRMDIDPHRPDPPDWSVPALASAGEDGIVACSDAHPIPDDLKPFYASRTHRRVELVFAPSMLLDMGDGE